MPLCYNVAVLITNERIVRMSNIVHKKKRLSSSRKIVLGFAATILVGAILLMLPISSKSGAVTPFNQALFTSTSAVCVTGLVLNDTGSYWSVFGQAVILLLIQIGGHRSPRYHSPFQSPLPWRGVKYQ